MDAAHVLTVLTALELLAVLLLQSQLGFQLGDASLGQLPTQLLVFLNQHSTLGHQFLPRLAVRETSLTSHSEPGDKHNRQRSAVDLFQLPETQAKVRQKPLPTLPSLNESLVPIRFSLYPLDSKFNIKLSRTHFSLQISVNYFLEKIISTNSHFFPLNYNINYGCKVCIKTLSPHCG